MAPQTKAATSNADWWREAALTKDESDARSLAKVRGAYNNWRRSRGWATIPYQRLHDIEIGRVTHPLLTRPVNYNDPFDVYRSVYDEGNYKRVFMPWPERDEEAYKNMSIAPSDKSTRMGSPVKPAFPQSYNEFVDQQTKTAGIVGKVDINVHPEDELGNIVTLMKGIRGKWNGLNYRVPKGFESDGVSTPSFLWPIISPPVHPKTIRAGIVHDWLYRHQPKKWSREDADKLFAELCREDGLSDVQTELAYAGLRLFGGNAWDNNAERKENELAARKAARIADRLAAKAKEAKQLEKAASMTKVSEAPDHFAVMRPKEPTGVQQATALGTLGVTAGLGAGVAKGVFAGTPLFWGPAAAFVAGSVGAREIEDRANDNLRAAQKEADKAATENQKAYNASRVARGKAPIDYDREARVLKGDAPWLLPGNYEDPVAVKEMERLDRIRKAMHIWSYKEDELKQDMLEGKEPYIPSLSDRHTYMGMHTLDSSIDSKYNTAPVPGEARQELQVGRGKTA